jgi:hypothetical protein
LTINADGQNANQIKFSGNVALKSNLVLSNVTLTPVSTTANWTLGKYNLTLDKVKTPIGSLSGSAALTLKSGTSLETTSNLSVATLNLDTTSGSVTIKCGGKMTLTLVNKLGEKEATIIKPKAGTITVNGIGYGEGLEGDSQKITVLLEGSSYSTGTVILSGKAASIEYYKVYVNESSSENQYKTYVNGTNLLLGQKK